MLSRIVILGGEASITSQLERTIKASAGVSITRLAVADRYCASTKIVDAQ